MRFKKVFFPFFFITLIVFTFTTYAQEYKELPPPTSAINDFAEVISPDSQKSMENLAREVLEKTGTSVVVVTIKTIQGEDPDEYANRLYEAWGIGKKGEDKGVLIFLALKERRIRIETGYGVEGILPDGLVGEILDKYVVPHLKSKDYDKGLLNAEVVVSSLIAKDANVSLTGSPSIYQPKKSRRSQGSPFSIIVTLLILSLLLGTRQGRAILPFILLMLLAGGRGGGSGFGGFGGGFGGFGGGMSGGGGVGRGF